MYILHGEDANLDSWSSTHHPPLCQLSFLWPSLSTTLHHYLYLYLLFMTVDNASKGLATITGIAGLENPRILDESKPKSIIFDAQLWISGQSRENGHPIVGIFKYYNEDDLPFGPEDVGYYFIHATVGGYHFLTPSELAFKLTLYFCIWLARDSRSRTWCQRSQIQTFAAQISNFKITVSLGISNRWVTYKLISPAVSTLNSPLIQW